MDCGNQLSFLNSGEDRGWFQADDIWTGEISEADAAANSGVGTVNVTNSSSPEVFDQESFARHHRETGDYGKVLECLHSSPYSTLKIQMPYYIVINIKKV